MERVTGIGGVFFKARDGEKLAAWYREHLGIEVSPEGWYYPFQWKDDPQLEGAGSTVWAIFPHDTDYFGPGPAPFMINFRVANLDAMLAQLRAAGVPVEDRVEDHPYGRFGWATDPEGNRIELWQPTRNEE